MQIFSFRNVEDVLKVATTISITNTMLWKNNSEGTKEMFVRENKARVKYCRMFDASIHCKEFSDPAQTTLLKKQLSEDYYKKEE